MKYIFFDIECANCYQGKGKICSFGYVITDTAFNILEKCDLVINPAAKFNLGPDIVLAYDKSTFKNAPMFPDFYAEIASLLEDEDTMVFGFSACNDARYLNNDCIRYNLPGIDYTFYDIQQMVMGIRESKNQPSLVGSLHDYGIEENQDIHKSDDDSLMSMKLLRAICEKEGKDTCELIELYPQCIGVVDEYVFRWKNPPVKPPKAVKAQSPLSNKMGKTTNNYKLFLSFLENVQELGADNPRNLEGRAICLSSYYEEKHFRQMVALAQLICSAGGKIVTRLRECNCFVDVNARKENGERKYCSRYDAVKRINKHSAKIDVINFAELLSLLSISHEELEELSANISLIDYYGSVLADNTDELFE